MRTSKTYHTVMKQDYRPELRTCLTCGKRLRRSTPLSPRTVITLAGASRVMHRGDRCPAAPCATHTRI